MAKVLISLGTNLGDKSLNLNNAIAHINNSIGLVAQKSSIYETKPWGFESFNNFLNQVIVIQTSLAPIELMKELLQLERAMGRIRDKAGYQDRLIDIDILFYDDLVINANDVTIPHPKLHLRKFILEPLAEIEPELRHPVLNKTIKQLLTDLTTSR